MRGGGGSEGEGVSEGRREGEGVRRGRCGTDRYREKC